MDVPDLDELELLESHAYDEDFDFEPEPNPPSSPDPEIKDAPKRVPLVLPSALNKRLLSDPIQSHAKKIRRDQDANFSMDIPDIEELELLESRAYDGDDDVEFEHMEVHSKSADDNGKTDAHHESSDEEVEEWLRYSPPSPTEENVVLEKEKEEIILSRYATEIDGDFVPVTGLDGERVYAKKCGGEIGDNYDGGRRKLSVIGDNGLLEEPVRVLMQKVEDEEFKKALKDSVEGPTEIIPLKAPVTNEKLWVDKYAPSSFTELLSDEQTNREVLLWLKQWDSCVFGSEIKSTADDVLSALRRHSSGSQHSKQSTRNYYRNNSEIKFSSHSLRTHNKLDEESNITTRTSEETFEKKHKVHGPPEQKILLLCGPPGLGKTTLAHVAARHCGYRVVEINASDDRSSATIEAKILDVVQMNSVVADAKPKCLVIDEIDGALGEGKGAVEVILQLVSAEKKGDIGKENMHKEMHSGRKNTQKKHKNSLLLRPVICICNDLYAPALRPLRHVAKVHIFSQPTVSRVVNRLKHICKREGVKTSSIALTALAEYTECDIRSCLNTLQFLNKKKETLNVSEISSQVVGRKDASKSAFDIWKEIFQKRKGKRARKSNKSNNSTSSEFEFLYTMISNRGDYDLILEGIHENILQLRYVDPVLFKTVQCLDNLVVSDITHRYIMRTQKMILQVYQPAIAISIRGVVAQVEKADIQWPKSFQRCRTISKERVDMFQSWHHRIFPYISRHLSPNSFVEDSISQLLHIISPPTLRPVALHLLSESEKENLGQLIDVMVSYAVTYKNVKHVDDSVDASALDLYPPLGDFICFKGYNSCHVDLSLAMKQVLVHEVEKQKILQNNTSKSIDTNGNRASAKNVTESGPSSKSANGRAEAKMDAKLPRTSKTSQVSKSTIDEAKSVKRTKKASSDITSFFDRFRKVGDESCGMTNDANKRPRRDSHTLLFKFNEGFTNAVKRPVRVREFLF